MEKNKDDVLDALVCADLTWFDSYLTQYGKLPDKAAVTPQGMEAYRLITNRNKMCEICETKLLYRSSLGWMYHKCPNEDKTKDFLDIMLDIK